MILFRSFFHSKNSKEVSKKIKKLSDGDSMESVTTIFSGSDRVYKNGVFSGANLVAIFGGISDDRKNTTESAKHTIYIDTAGAFGGLTIKDKKKK